MRVSPECLKHTPYPIASGQPCGQRCHASARAFTLIEILAAVSIIAVLLIILAPTISTVRKSAQTAQTTSNMRQIALATRTYAADNNGSFPGPLYVRHTAIFSPTAKGLLGNYLSPYIDTRKAKGYPNMLSSELFLDQAWQEAVIAQGLELNLACRLVRIADQPGLGNVNIFGIIGTADKREVQPLRVEDIAQYPYPHKMWMLAEPDKEWSTNSLIIDKPLHKGGRHVIFFDYHVEITYGPRPVQSLQ